MTPEQRDQKNDLAFLDHFAALVKVNGGELRPPGYLSLRMIQLLGLAMGQGKEAIAALTPTQLRDQIHAYFFLQAAPLPEVSRAVRRYCSALDADPAARPAAWDLLMAESVDPFLFGLNPALEAQAAAQLAQLGDVVAAQVQAQPPPTPGHTAREFHDPNS